MIPKTLHYCWFGGNPKPEIVLQCIQSWHKHCPDFIIKEWNENNFDVEAQPFTALMYKQQHWAFVADYARLVVLENEGGIYLDTDMLLVQSLSPLLNCSLLLGEEETGIISAGMIGAVRGHEFIRLAKNEYDSNIKERITIPRVLTKIFSQYKKRDGVTVLPPESFYPYSAQNIHHYHGQILASHTYGIHLWNYSWGHPLNKLAKRIGIYSSAKKIAEKLYVKSIIKKLLGII